MIRLSFAPLEREVRARIERETGLARDVQTNEIALYLGISVRSIHEYRRVGLNPWLADRLAIKLNLHPLMLWGFNAWMGAVSTPEEPEPE